jgi:cytochrome c
MMRALRQNWRARHQSGNIRCIPWRQQSHFDPEILMNRLAVALALSSAVLATPTWAALDNASAQALMKKDGCAACHAIDKKLIGPAYQDVAAKYAGDKTVVAKLIKKVKEGGSGVWGAIPMPPNSATSDADIKELVTWILTLKK